MLLQIAYWDDHGWSWCHQKGAGLDSGRKPKFLSFFPIFLWLVWWIVFMIAYRSFLFKFPSISMTITEMRGMTNDVIPAIDRQLADIKIRLGWVKLRSSSPIIWRFEGKKFFFCQSAVGVSDGWWFFYSHHHPSDKAILCCALCNAQNYAYESRSSKGTFFPETRFEPLQLRHSEVPTQIDIPQNSWLSETKTKVS